MRFATPEGLRALPGRVAPLVIGLAVAMGLDLVGTVEWSHANCNVDGRGFAAYGTPLPYLRWTGASSLEYLFLPHIWALDLLIVAAPVAALTWRLRGPFRVALGVLAALLVSMRMALVVLLLGIGVWQPRAWFVPYGMAYWDYRPVGWSSDAHYECKPMDADLGAR